MGGFSGHLRVKDTSRSAWNGTFKESFDARTTSDGVTITMSLEKKGGGDLTMQFSDGDSVLDCTPAATIALTAGSSTAPQANYIYILQSTKALTKSTSDWPTAEHIKISFFFVQSASDVQTNGALINQNWNDELEDNVGQGHITHIGGWIRRKGANWFSGIAGAGSDDWIDIVGASSPDDVYFKSFAGVISQMHLHSYPAKDSSSGDEIFIVNHDTTPYTAVTNLNSVLTDSAGVSMSGNYFNLVFAGVANKGGEYGPLLCLLPSGSYNNESDAINDVDNYDTFALPREFTKDSSTGFLICRMTLKHAVGGGGTWTVVNSQDLRGQTGDVASGGGAGGSVTEFSDNQFTIFNASDNTKILDFDLSGLTTSTTRTITMPDKDVDLQEVYNYHIQVQAVDDATDMAVADGVAYFNIPTAFNGGVITEVSAYVTTAGTTGTCDIQIHNVTDAVDLLSTKITIDTTELTSHTAATPPVINAANDDVATGDLWRIDVDAIHTTAAKGLRVYLKIEV